MPNNSSQQEIHGISARALAGWEIVSVVVSCLLAEWFVLSFFGNSRWVVVIPGSLALILVIYSQVSYGENLKQLGFRFDNFFAASRTLVIPTIICLIAVLFVSWLAGSFSLKPLRWRYVWLPLWALFQQYFLQGFINRRAQIILGPGFASVLLVALIFALLHLPNPLLTGITFIGGALLAMVYQRQPNLFALAISHSLVSLFLALSWPATALNNLRVGFKFFG
jgi:membrane protease YdiL (CAAX protease family)